MMVKQKSNISRGMIFENKIVQALTFHETNKSNNKNHHDYIANSQCGGLYSYGKLLKRI